MIAVVLATAEYIITMFLFASILRLNFTKKTQFQQVFDSFERALDLQQKRRSQVIAEIKRSVSREMTLVWGTVFFLAVLYSSLFSWTAFLLTIGTTVCMFAIINNFAVVNTIAMSTKINFTHLNSSISLVLIFYNFHDSMINSILNRLAVRLN
jgi:hypothetical protein